MRVPLKRHPAPDKTIVWYGVPFKRCASVEQIVDLKAPILSFSGFLGFVGTFPDVRFKCLRVDNNNQLICVCVVVVQWLSSLTEQQHVNGANRPSLHNPY